MTIPMKETQGPTPIQSIYPLATDEGLFFISSIHKLYQRSGGPEQIRLWKWFRSERGMLRALDELLIKKYEHEELIEVRTGRILYSELWDTAKKVELNTLPNMETTFVLVSELCRKKQHQRCPGKGKFGEQLVQCECACRHASDSPIVKTT